MNDEPAFLDAILAAPDDLTARLVYADWLDDRADPRADYLRLGVAAAESPAGSDARTRLREMQEVLPTWWLAAVGFHATPQPPDPARVEAAARLLGRPVTSTDPDGYEIGIRAAATSGLTGAVAYLEGRSKWRDTFHDVRYYLRLRAADRREASCEPHTYNPYFGCRPQFLEWYGDAALMIYAEKHSIYACRLGFDGPAVTRELAHKSLRWVLGGRELAFRRDRGAHVLRLSVPDLTELPPLSEAEAHARDLLPPDR